VAPATSPAPAPAFDYSRLPPADRDWLRQRTEDLRGILDRSTRNFVRIGQVLGQARDRIEDKRFQKWVRAEFPWSRATAYRLIRVADEVGENLSQIETFGISALYVLTQPGTPPKAREEAFRRAARGERVTLADVRDLVSLHTGGRRGVAGERDRSGVQALRNGEYRATFAVRKTFPTEKEAADWLAAKRLAVAEEPTRPEAPDDAEDVLLDMLSDGGSVHVCCTAEEEDEPLYTVRWHPADPARRMGHACRRDLTQALAAAYGEEPTKVCQRCTRREGREVRHTLAEFSADATQPGGLNRYCRKSEAARLKRMKAERRAAATQAAAG
jgi:hypothetical protein